MNPYTGFTIRIDYSSHDGPVITRSVAIATTLSHEDRFVLAAELRSEFDKVADLAIKDIASRTP